MIMALGMTFLRLSKITAENLSIGELMPRRVTFFLELRIKAVFSDLQIHFRL